MTRRWYAKIRDLALNPDGVQLRLQSFLDELVQLTDAKKFTGCGDEQREIWLLVDGSRHLDMGYGSGLFTAGLASEWLSNYCGLTDAATVLGNGSSYHKKISPPRGGLIELEPGAGALGIRPGNLRPPFFVRSV